VVVLEHVYVDELVPGLDQLKSRFPSCVSRCLAAYSHVPRDTTIYLHMDMARLCDFNIRQSDNTGLGDQTGNLKNHRTYVKHIQKKKG